MNDLYATFILKKKNYDSVYIRDKSSSDVISTFTFWVSQQTSVYRRLVDVVRLMTRFTTLITSHASETGIPWGSNHSLLVIRFLINHSIVYDTSFCFVLIPYFSLTHLQTPSSECPTPFPSTGRGLLPRPICTSTPSSSVHTVLATRVAPPSSSSTISLFPDLILPGTYYSW